MSVAHTMMANTEWSLYMMTPTRVATPIVTMRARPVVVLHAPSVVRVSPV